MPYNYSNLFDWTPPTPAAPKSTNYGAQSSFNSNPLAQTYNSTYGGIPGDINLPQPSQDLSGVYPNLGATNAGVSSAIMGQLGGQLSPGTIAMLQDQGAAWGQSSGMPGSGLAQNRVARDLGLTSENLINQGIQNYARTIPSVSSTQTVNPALQTSIAERNATINSAPNPASSQSYAQGLFDNYLRQMRGPGGGGGGGPASGTGLNSDQLFQDGINNSLFASSNPASGSQGTSSYYSPPYQSGAGGSSLTWGTGSNSDFSSLFGDPYATDPYASSGSDLSGQVYGPPYDNSFDNADWLANFQPEG